VNQLPYTPQWWNYKSVTQQDGSGKSRFQVKLMLIKLIRQERCDGQSQDDCKEE
jgi:hypothetical protein